MTHIRYDNDNISEAEALAAKSHDEVVGKVMREIGANVNNDVELAVLMESLLLGSMLLSLRLFDTPPELIQRYFALVTDRALQRFDNWQRQS